ncbi:hypothetical protein [Paraburkholderia strydomiana]|uniref:hypothetical protein n=1 Tax=Paraburkholderia strydomiana TaxID=1245417 RepID=UPI0038B8D7ED
MQTTTRNEPAAVPDFSSGIGDAPSHALAISRKYAALSPERRRRFREKASEQGVDPARLPIVPLSREVGNANDADGVPSSPGSALYPLAPAQERLCTDVVDGNTQVDVSSGKTGNDELQALDGLFDALD